MLSLEYPSLTQELSEFSGGLFPVTVPETLVIKGTKEMILTAKTIRFIKFYLFRLDADDIPTAGLITAFFDDPDEPLVIRTPLFKDDVSDAIFHLLGTPSINIHFFDEHNRELLGYRANNTTASRFRSSKTNISLAPDTYIPTSKIDDQLSARFANRNQDVDDNAFVVTLDEELIPSKILHWDSRPISNQYQGRMHDMFTSLERKDPGLFSELDIVKCLTRVFPGEQVFLRPCRTDNGREFVDVLVATPTNLLLIQAKDSPNTAEMLDRPIFRKISAVSHHLKKAFSQMRGSISYMKSKEEFSVSCGSKEHILNSGDQTTWILVLVKELFPTEFGDYSQLVLDFSSESGYPCLVLDYVQFHEFTHHLQSEEAFFDGFQKVTKFTKEHGQLPRSRFWI